MKALNRLLRPLVRIALARQVSLRQIVELLKGIYVQIAVHEIETEGKRPTDSRISLLTGVHRKDVRRLRDETDPLTAEQHSPLAMGLNMRLVNCWLTDSRFTDEAGRPRPLSISAADDEPLSLNTLLAAVSSDIRSRAVLDEWLRLGIVTTDKKSITLRHEAFIPEQGEEEKLHFFAQNQGAHLQAGVRNLLGQAPPLFDRAVQYSALSEASIAELQTLSKDLAMQALQRINRRAAELKKRDSDHAGKNGGVINFGAYVLTEFNSEQGDSQ